MDYCAIFAPLRETSFGFGVCTQREIQRAICA